MTARPLALVVVLVAACGAQRAAPPPSPERYAGAGPIAVRGARPSDPGPVLLRTLERDPRTRQTVASRGEPDAVEILGRDGRAALIYRRGGSPRRIVVGGPEPRRTARAPRPAARPAEPTGPPLAPTPRQSLECPLDPARGECRALCAANATHEWCR